MLGWGIVAAVALTCVPVLYFACAERAERGWLSLSIGDRRSVVERKLWGFSSTPVSDPTFLSRYDMQRYMKSPDQTVTTVRYWFVLRNFSIVAVYDADGNLLAATPP